MESLRPESQSPKWKPGEYEYMEDVPDFELQKAYLDIADEIKKYAMMDEELGFNVTKIDKARELEKAFNNWFDGRIAKLPEVYQSQIREKFGDCAVRLINSDVADKSGNRREDPLILKFSYLPIMIDYKDLFKYEYREPLSEEELKEAGLGRVNEYWPVGKLPSKEGINIGLDDAA